MITYTLNEWKYVLNHRTKALSIFPVDISHDSQGRNWTSAGFLKFYLKEDECRNVYLAVSCFGKSDSLNLVALPEDSEAISMRIRPSML